VRLLGDDVPATLMTHLQLSVAGKSRETVLAQVLPDGFVPLGLDSELPARIEPDGRLRLQLRPGTWTIAVTGRHVGRPTTIALPAANGPWVSEEVWAFEAVPCAPRSHDRRRRVGRSDADDAAGGVAPVSRVSHEAR
jgi:hypothetical protein